MFIDDFLDIPLHASITIHISSAKTDLIVESSESVRNTQNIIRDKKSVS